MSGELDVLVVEDEPAIAASMAHVLARRGHAVATVEGVHAALERPEPDVLVTDLTFGEGATGFDLLEALTVRDMHPHVVIVSGAPTLSDCRRAMQYGARDFLPKPFHLDELVTAVERPLRAGAPLGSRFERRFLADVEGVEAAVRQLLAFALERGVGPAVRGRLGTACAEVLENVGLHAYLGEPGEFELSAERRPGELVVTVHDRGVGFDALEAAAGPWLDAPGSGLARAACLCEDLRVDSEPAGGARVRLVFHTHPSTFEDEAPGDLSELDYLEPAASRRVLELVTSESEELLNLPPALAVSVGRLLSGLPRDHVARTALWG